EDGIRDLIVTGVQTCALPISYEDGVPLPEGPQVVYVSPLKALAVDINQNLEAPLRGIAEVAGELGLPAPRIQVAVRTGDTTASEIGRAAWRENAEEAVGARWL